LPLLFEESVLLETGVGFAFRFGFDAACSSVTQLIPKIGQTNEQRGPLA
jgi:hypothetical protein